MKSLAKAKKTPKELTPKEKENAALCKRFDARVKKTLDSLPPILKKHLQRFKTATPDSLVFAIMRDLCSIDGFANSDFTNSLLHNRKIFAIDIEPNNIETAYLKGFHDAIEYILENERR